METEPLEVPDAARADRLARRVAALERQLEARIEQVEDLKRQLAHLEKMLQAERADGQALAELERKAAEYDALMRTLTMRVLNPARSWYGAVRRWAKRSPV